MLKVFVLFSFYLISINGHGYLFEPIARSSAWLIDPDFKACCSYESHMEMFCGGVGHQWNSNGGKCSICGEPYDRAKKLFEKDGSKYLGKIVQTYNQGQQIDVQIKLSANHHGYFEFRLCSLDSTPTSDATQECLDRHILMILDSNSTKYRDIAKHGSEMIHIRVQLPLDLACQHCVFQWKYTTGNNWGRDPSTNKSGPGLGRENETFMGCSDIRIHPKKTIRHPPLKTIPSKKDSKGKNRFPKNWYLISNFLLNQLATTSTTKSLSFQDPIRIPLWSGILVPYQKGDIVLYNGIKYRCVTSHRSYTGAEPSLLTWALWQRV